MSDKIEQTAWFLARQHELHTGAADQEPHPSVPRKKKTDIIEWEQEKEKKVHAPRATRRVKQ